MATYFAPSLLQQPGVLIFSLAERVVTEARQGLLEQCPESTLLSKNTLLCLKSVHWCASAALAGSEAVQLLIKHKVPSPAGK